MDCSLDGKFYPVKYLYLAYKKILTTIFHFYRQFGTLFILDVADWFIAFLNIISPNQPVDQNVPKPFSPESPPPFFEHPFIYLICLLAWIIGPDLSPDWLNQWSVWKGLGPDGRWAEVNLYEAKEGSRSPCPALNALANHGIINPSGCELTFHQITSAAARAYNCSPAFAIRSLLGAYPIVEGRQTIKLSDLSAHGIIAHDASLLRSSHRINTGPDIYSPAYARYKDVQSHPWPDLINRFFPAGDCPVTPRECSEALSIRRAECQAENPRFHRTLQTDIIGCMNCSVLLTVTGGDRKVIRNLTGIAGYEQFDRDWKPAGRQAYGISGARLQFLGAWIGFGTDSYFLAKRRDI
ncbi:uncharacterized protein MELLADRAFT_87309 [Melampsora larici-populina 98AG31]|uniref:Heme haloperoxidase family profile domain-containing protein n=1 Tax=Melampsora larici-populina (strain 98AG31 / pathotype 3-4-7) TaxID=747676 RepID=F4RMS8_MELLP|nr:uncharacterized protein MELLADRAFT_87309 [Melampsora larici-populina 98AG31]EGG06162.1 hypothetical protein MELLADRAFT_87309 [Melampsora larici-populina 98AG31]